MGVIPKWLAIETLSEAANDIGVPDTVAAMVGWIFKFIIRLWDEPVIREWRKTQEELRAKRIGLNTYTKEYEFAVAAQVRRTVYSVRRSLKRIRKCSDKRDVGITPSGRFNTSRLN